MERIIDELRETVHKTYESTKFIEIRNNILEK